MLDTDYVEFPLPIWFWLTTATRNEEEIQRIIFL